MVRWGGKEACVSERKRQGWSRSQNADKQRQVLVCTGKEANAVVSYRGSRKEVVTRESMQDVQTPCTRS